MTTRIGSWKRPLILGAACALFAGLSGAAQAADFCMEWQTVSQTHTLVGKGFRLPTRGRCKPFYGVDAYGGQQWEATGSACTSTAGDEVHFLVTYMAQSYAPIFLDIALPLPLGGYGEITASGVNGLFTVLSVSPKDCNPGTVPIQ